MTQFYSRIDTKFNGDVYNIPFSYSKESEISVYLDDELFTGWYFLNESQIKFTELPSKTPEIVTIKRTTDITKKVVEYTNNTMLSKEALNLSQDQLLNAVQEIYDNNIEFKDDTTNQVVSFESRIDEVEATTAESANIVAENAVLATTAKTNSEQAVATANSAYDTATEALLTSEQANSFAFEAKDAAASALNISTTSSNKVDVFEESIETVLEAADKITVLEGAVGEATEAAQAAQEAVQAVGEMIDAIDGKANVDLDNLSDVGQAKFEEKANKVEVLDKTQITNCLLEVPQNIKLELNNGTLTLKAGSKVIVPNGVDVFDEVVIEKDISVSNNISGTHTRLVYYNATKKGYEILNVHSSGTTAPTTTSNQAWYDTANNKVKHYNAGVDTGDVMSLPIGVVTAGNNYLCNTLDQVFNGFGYIGSTYWRGKGIKGLFANGKNEDGTLNNIESTTTNVVTKTLASNYTRSNYSLVLDKSGGIGTGGYIEYNGVPSSLIPDTTWVFNTQDNRVYQSDGSKYVLKNSGLVKLATVNTQNGVFTSFEQKQPFRAVDYNDLETEIKETKTELITQIDNKVNKTGDTMAGALNISMQGQPDINLYNKTLDHTMTKAPSSTVYYGTLRFFDKNNRLTGQCLCYTDTGNNVNSAITAVRNINGTNISSTFTTMVRADGTQTCAATAGVKKEIARWSYPSTKYVDLTLGASGTEYVAPANGYVVTRSNTTGTWSFIHLFDPTTMRGNTTLWQVKSVLGLVQTLPVQKGQKFRMDYDQRDFTIFRFVYAQGEV